MRCVRRTTEFRGARGATLVVVLILALLVSGAAMLVVQQTLSAARATTSAVDDQVAARAAADLVTQFEEQLAADPGFYNRELFYAERPRLCAGTPIVASGDPQVTVAWPSTCPSTWTYPAAGTTVSGYDPASVLVRAEVIPASATSATLTLRVRADVGAGSASVQVGYDPTSAARVQVYAEQPLALDTLAGTNAPVQVSGTVYALSGGTLGSNALTTAGDPYAGALLTSECGFTGPTGTASVREALSAADRISCPNPATATEDVRTVASVPLVAAAADRSFSDLLAAACTQASYSTPTVDVAGVPRQMSTQLCLRAGATLTDAADDHVVVVPTGVVAYRLTFNADATLTVDITGTWSDTPDAATARALYAAGGHPLSPVGATWSTLGTFAMPTTAVIATDARTLVGSCNAAVGGTTCDTQSPATPVTVVAGTVSAPQELVVAGPVAGTAAAPLGLISTGSLVVPFWSHLPGADLSISAALYAAGNSTIVSTSAADAPGGELHISGSLGARALSTLTGWTGLQVSPAAALPPRFVTFTDVERRSAFEQLSDVALCGVASCATTW